MAQGACSVCGNALEECACKVDYDYTEAPDPYEAPFIPKPSITWESALGLNWRCTICNSPIVNGCVSVCRALYAQPVDLPEIICIPCAAAIGKASGNV